MKSYLLCPAPSSLHSLGLNLTAMQLKLSQRPAVGARASRRTCVRVDAKVSKKDGEPRVIRGKCFVTKDVSV